MFRVLFVFFAFCVLFQSGWAVTSAYCSHEANQVKQHLGHHDDQHRQANETQKKQITASSLNGDCETCCHTHINILASAKEAPLLLAASQTSLTWSVPVLPENPSPRPERPKWSLVG